MVLRQPDHTGAYGLYCSYGVLRRTSWVYNPGLGFGRLQMLPARSTLRTDKATMQHQSVISALTTEELVLGLEDLTTEDSKMNLTGLLHMLAQATLAMGLCGIVNFIAN